MNDEDFKAWELDTTRDTFRILLIEIDYPATPIYHPSIKSDSPAGTIYLASNPWVSYEGQCYDDSILSLPDMESSLESFGGVGGFKAKNVDDSIRWDDVFFHGQECRWLWGDRSWARSMFKTIETTVVDECAAEGGSVYEFSLLDSGLKLRKLLVSENQTRLETVQQFVDWVADEIGVLVSFSNVPENKKTLSVEVDLTPYTTAESVLRDIARDINAGLRRTKIGEIEIFAVSSAITEISINEIASNTIPVVEVVRPYSSIEITMPDDVTLSRDTNVPMGDIERVLKIDTYLTNPDDVETLLSEMVLDYIKPSSIYQLPISMFGSTLMVGEKVSTDHPDLVRNAVIQRIDKTPLSSATYLEVRA